MIGPGYKSRWFDNSTPNISDMSTEILIDFGQTRTPKSLLLVNNCNYANEQMYIGNSHVRVGYDSTPFSTGNVTVKGDIVEGGIFSFDATSG